MKHIQQQILESTEKIFRKAAVDFLTDFTEKWKVSAEKYTRRIVKRIIKEEIKNMDKRQQDKLWSNLSKTTQEEYREKYKFHLADSKREVECDDGGYDLTVLRSETIVKELETMFGTHNLNPKLTPKTWEDVEKEEGSIELRCLYDLCSDGSVEDVVSAIAYDCKLSEKLIQKAIATLKIAKLIELGYGGLVSEEEWKSYPQNSNAVFYSIICNHKGKLEKKEVEYEIFPVERNFITFHSLELLEEFMTHENNRKLVEQYYLM